MPNSHFDKVERAEDGTIHLIGPIDDISVDTRVRVQVTVIQSNDFVAEAQQVVNAKATVGGATPTIFNLTATPTSWKLLDPVSPLIVAGLLVSEVGEFSQWFDELEPVQGQTASSVGAIWRRR
jgi:hypothetical protein